MFFQYFLFKEKKLERLMSVQPLLFTVSIETTTKAAIKLWFPYTGKKVI